MVTDFGIARAISEGAERAPDGDRHRDRHAGVHVARAVGRRPRHRRTQRPLLARRRRLPDALRRPAVQRQQHAGAAGEAPVGAPGADRAALRRRAARPRARRDAAAREEPGRPLPERRRRSSPRSRRATCRRCRRRRRRAHAQRAVAVDVAARRRIRIGDRYVPTPRRARALERADRRAVPPKQHRPVHRRRSRCRWCSASSTCWAARTCCSSPPSGASPWRTSTPSCGATATTGTTSSASRASRWWVDVIAGVGDDVKAVSEHEHARATCARGTASACCPRTCCSSPSAAPAARSGERRRRAWRRPARRRGARGARRPRRDHPPHRGDVDAPTARACPTSCRSATTLADTVMALAAQLAELERVLGAARRTSIDKEIAAARGGGEPARPRGQRGARAPPRAMLKRQRRTVVDTGQPAREARRRLDSCALALKNMRFDVLRLKTGAQTYQHVTTVAEQAMRSPARWTAPSTSPTRWPPDEPGAPGRAGTPMSEHSARRRSRVDAAVGALYHVEAEIGRGGMAVVYRAR